jgi:hypothetical protein
MDQASLWVAEGINWPVVVGPTTALSGAYPTQLEADTYDFRKVYVRYRYGVLRVDLDGHPVFRKAIGKNLTPEVIEEELKTIFVTLSADRKDAMRDFHKKMWEMAVKANPEAPFHSLDGCLTEDELLQHTDGYFVWPRLGGKDL